MRPGARRSRHQSAARKQRVRHYTRVISNDDAAMMRRIEQFIVSYDGDNLLHDIELSFPGASYRAFFLAYHRAQDPLRWFPAEGSA